MINHSGRERRVGDVDREVREVTERQVGQTNISFEKDGDV